ncbi:DUF4198 domain-containing protein [Natroniella acetigena]|uniref:DUF4198 domain-containing protein n=1 Tax=Natroniella acetigena TaxID=52004 RepID=UPI003D154676
MVLNSSPFGLTAGSEVEVEIHYLGHPLANHEFQVIPDGVDEDDYEDTVFKTDYAGQATIELEASGGYLLFSQFEVIASGEHDTREYDRIRHNNSVFLEVE